MPMTNELRLLLDHAEEERNRADQAYDAELASATFPRTAEHIQRLEELGAQKQAAQDHVNGLWRQAEPL
jgi:hypothetical protein